MHVHYENHVLSCVDRRFVKGSCEHLSENKSSKRVEVNGLRFFVLRRKIPGLLHVITANTLTKY